MVGFRFSVLLWFLLLLCMWNVVSVYYFVECHQGGRCCEMIVLFSCVMAFPKLSRLVACMCDMSMRDFVVESPFASLLLRLCQSSLLFRLVNINNVTNQSCPLCPASRGTEWLRFRYIPLPKPLLHPCLSFHQLPVTSLNPSFSLSPLLGTNFLLIYVHSIVPTLFNRQIRKLYEVYRFSVSGIPSFTC